MVEAATETVPVATLALTFGLTIGDEPTTPPTQLVTGVRGRENELRELRDDLDAVARRAFRSDDVLVQDLEFRDVRPGEVSAVLDIVMRDTEPMTTDRFAGGLTSFTDQSGGPFGTYLREVIGDPLLRVVVISSHVEQPEPPAPVPRPPYALTTRQQTLARWITGLMLAPVALFVLGVLHVFPFSIGLITAGSVI